MWAWVGGVRKEKEKDSGEDYELMIPWEREETPMAQSEHC